MLFRLLGPLEVTDAERPLRIGAGRQRSVLLMLLVHRNEVVASERLVDALWGEEPPPTAAKVLQNAVGQLRRALGDQEARRLQTRGHGYVMRVAQGELDVDRFEELVQDGGRTLADGRPGEAAARLREALVLWRGPPLADVTYEAFAQPEIARLEELFATALERRIEAELALGAHADLVSELEALVARYPLRERLRGQLMLALYRCERQADALAAFREGRRLLVEEVGVEPGPELRELHEAILRQEPGLAFQRPELPPELDAGSAPPLAGRQEELRWLLEQWLRARDGDGALIGLSGESGIGKTRLAAELAGEVHGAGALVVYARGTDCEVAVARARQPGRPVLIVVEDPEVKGPPWRAGDVADMVLVTADRQDRLAALGVTASLALGPLDVHAVAAIASAYTPDRSATEVPAEDLLEASGGVPRRVHEAAKAWAAQNAARRVIDIAPSAAADRSRLRQTEARLAGRLLELQETRERLDSFDDGDAVVVCPFKGLASFEFADAPYFSGRERLIAELIARAVGAPLLGLVGPSGSGKSSLVRAGLLPALAAGVLPGSTEWPRTLIRPGEHPMRELAGADRHAGVLAVDQLEELFTACRDEEERRAFVEALSRLGSRRDGEGLVVVALRADYYGRCAAYPALSRLLGPNHVLVGPMEAHELRRAIERPAARAGLEVDGAVVDSIVADVKGEPGALPLVSSALLELWQRRDGRRLRHDTYKATSGVRGAVARLAESAFAQLDPGQQRSARDLLVRLAADGPAGEVVRRRVQLTDLNAGAEGDVRRVLALLAEHRLLTVSATSVEVAHEALLREWPRLRGWLEADAQSRRVHRHLSQAATDWQERGGDPADLYRGARLAGAQEWGSGHENQLNAAERAFLDASRTAAERHQRRLRLALAGVAALLAVAILGAIVAVHQRGAARRQARTAEAQRIGLQALTEPDLARSLLLAREGVVLADSAVTRGNLFSALVRYPSALAEVQSGTNPVRAIDLSPDGRTLVVGDNQGNVELIDPLTRRRIRAPLKLGSRITAVRFSPDGTRLAVTTVDFDGSGNIHLLDTRTWAGHGPFDIGFGPAYLDVAAPVFSPDSRVLAADVVAANDPTFDHNVVRWDARTGRRLAAPSPIPSTREDAPALGGYTHAGTALVTSSATSGATVIRDASSLRPLRRLNGGGSPTATSADGRYVALADRRGSLRLLDLHTGRLRVLGAHLTAIRFTPDSRRLVTTGRDATLTLWNATRATPTRTIGPLPASARALAISEDGRTAYGADETGGVIAWDLTGSRGLGRSFVLAWRRPIALAAPEASSPLVAVADADRGLELLDTQTLAPARRIPIHGGADAITIAPDGRTAAFGTHDGSVGFADLHTGRLLRPPEPSHVNAVRDLVFSPDGRWLATTDGRIVFLWDAWSRRTLAAFQGVVGVATSVRFSPGSRSLVVADARPGGSGALDELSLPHLRLIRQAIVPPLSQLTFSQDGKILFSAEPGGRVWLLDTRTWKPLGSPLPTNATRLAIDPTDRLLATSSTGGAVELWDVRAGRPLGGTLLGIARGAALLAFADGGRALVTLQTDGTARVWDVRPQSWTRRACAIAGRPLTRAEWHDALPDLPYSPACAARR